MKFRKSDLKLCKICNRVITYTDSDTVKCRGDIWSDDGDKEYKISGVCEFCQHSKSDRNLSEYNRSDVTSD